MNKNAKPNMKTNVRLFTKPNTSKNAPLNTNNNAVKLTKPFTKLHTRMSAKPATNRLVRPLMNLSVKPRKLTLKSFIVNVLKFDFDVATKMSLNKNATLSTTNNVKPLMKTFLRKNVKPNTNNNVKPRKKFLNFGLFF